MVKTFNGHTPAIAASCFVAENATIIGDVTLQEEATVWFGAVVRGDADTIVIGKGSNVQDCAVLHTDRGFRLTLGEKVTIGHCAVVHGAEVGDNVIVGMHATLLNGCKIGKNSIIGAGALVREGQVIPENSLVVGCPGKVIRELSAEQVADNTWNADHYIELGKKYKA